jgi:hypothetical protein
MKAGLKYFVDNYPRCQPHDGHETDYREHGDRDA